MKKFIVLFMICLPVMSMCQKHAMIPEDMWKMGRISEIQLSPDNAAVLYGVTFYDLSTNKSNRDLYLTYIDSDKTVKLTNTPSSEYNAVFHPTKSEIYYLAVADDAMQIFSMNYDGGNIRQISYIEGGINAFKFAPDGIHLVYTQDVKLDKSPTDVYPDLQMTNVRIIDDLMYRHWDTWHDYAYSHPFVTTLINDKIAVGVDVLAGMKYDTPMNPWGGMEQINWSPDGTKLAYTCKKLVGREYAVSTNSDIYIYDVASGKTSNISEFNLGYDHDPVFSPSGRYLAWKSMETPGFEADKERIMLYNFENEKVSYLTENFDQSCNNYQWNAKEDRLYFLSGHNATKQIYYINPKTKDITQITKGQHDYVEYVLGDGFIIGAKQSMSMPTAIYKVNITSGAETVLSHVNDELLSSIEMGNVEERWIKTVDGKDMLVWVIYPPFFDASQKYPAILYCEGGPQSALSQFWSYRWNFQMMAANGYVVIAPNRHGVTTFGQEWTDQISGDYGGLNQQDYLQAVDVISKEPFIDADRMGAVGASYGGYSVYWLAGHHENRFKAFIAHCGIFDFYSMYGSTEEVFFTNHDYEGPYWQKPEPKSYKYSPHLYVQNWNTPILIIVGEHDYRIPYTQSLEAFNCAQLLGVPSKLLFFNNETHFVVLPQNAVLWQREFKSWLDTYLK